MEPQLTEQDGLLTVRADGTSLGQLDPALVEARFTAHGALWLRGFHVTAEDYLAFVRQFSSELITLNTRERVRMRAVPEIQSVTGGPEALNFHVEMGHIPGRPEFLSFWCQTPSTVGGQTLLADGIQVWRALSDEARQTFLARKIRYETTIPWAWWTDRLQSEDPALARAALAKFDDVETEFLIDDSLVVTWTTSAVFRPMFSDELCLASNLFPYVVPGLQVTFDDGTPLPAALQQALADAAERVTHEITWSPSDVVLFDNTRWLHGRRAPGGIRRRRMQMLQGYLRFATGWQRRFGAAPDPGS